MGISFFLKWNRTFYLQIMWIVNKWISEQRISLLEGCCQRKLNNAHLIDMWVLCTNMRAKTLIIMNVITMRFFPSLEKFFWILLKGFRVSACEYFVHMRAETFIILNVITMRFFPFLQVHLNSVGGFWCVKLELGRALKFQIHLVYQTAQLWMQLQFSNKVERGNIEKKNIWTFWPW